MKRKISIAALICSTCLTVRAQWTVNFAFTNYLNQPDTNAFRVQPVTTPILANGGFIVGGPSQWLYPNSNGLSSIVLQKGNYLATNAPLGKGFIFAVPTGTGTANSGDLAISGFNQYNYSPPGWSGISAGANVTVSLSNGVYTISSSGGGGSVPGNVLTNGQSVATTISNQFAVDITHAFVASNTSPQSVAAFDAGHNLTNSIIDPTLSFAGNLLAVASRGISSNQIALGTVETNNLSKGTYSWVLNSQFNQSNTVQDSVYSPVTDQVLINQTNPATTTMQARRIAVGDLPMSPLGQSINLERLFRTMYLTKTRNTATAPISIIAFGDSTSEDARSAYRAICDQLALNFGYQEAQQDNSRGINQYYTLSGVPVLLNADANWWIPHFIMFPGDSITVSNNLATDGTIPLNAIRQPYLQWTNGGTFRIDFDNPPGTWTPAVTINANAANYIGENITNVLVTISGAITPTHFRIVALTGTNYIAQYAGLILTPNPGTSKIRAHHLGQGGIGMNTFMSCNTNVQASCWSNLAPDLVIVGLKNNEQATTAENLWKLYNSTTNTAPGCDFLFVGTTPSQAAPYLDWPLVNATERAFCVSNGIAYLDSAALTPMYDLALTNADTNWMFANGWFTSNDGIHATLDYWNGILQPFYRFIGLQASPNLSGFRADRMFIGATPDQGVTNALVVANPAISSGIWKVTPIQGQTGVRTIVNGSVTEANDGVNSIHSVGTSGRHFWEYNNGTAFGGQTTPSGSWYFGDSSSAPDNTVGNVFIEHSLYTGGPFTNAGLTSAHAIATDSNGKEIAASLVESDISGLPVDLSQRVLTNDSRNLVLSSPTNNLGTDVSATHLYASGLSAGTITNTGLTGQPVLGTDANGRLIPGSATGSGIITNSGTGFNNNFTNATLSGNVLQTNGYAIFSAISGSTITNTGLISASAVATDSSGKLIQASVVVLTNDSRNLVLSGSTNNLGTNVSAGTFWTTNITIAGSVTNLSWQTNGIVITDINGNLTSVSALNTPFNVQWDNLDTAINIGTRPGGGVIQLGLRSGQLMLNYLPVSVNGVDSLTLGRIAGPVVVSDNTSTRIYDQSNASPVITIVRGGDTSELITLAGNIQSQDLLSGGLYINTNIFYFGQTNGLNSIGLTNGTFTINSNLSILGQFQAASLTIGNMYITNQYWYTNNFPANPGAINLDWRYAYQFISTNANFTIGGFINASNGLVNKTTVGVSNSSASSITVTFPQVFTTAGATLTSVSVPAGMIYELPFQLDAIGTNVLQTGGGSSATATYVTGNNLPLTNSINGTNSTFHYGLFQTNDTTHDWQIMTNESLFWTNAVTGNWGYITNDQIYLSNRVTLLSTYITNGSAVFSNNAAASLYSQLNPTNLIISTGQPGSNTFYDANGTTVITALTNGGGWFSHDLSDGGFFRGDEYVNREYFQTNGFPLAPGAINLDWRAGWQFISTNASFTLNGFINASNNIVNQVNVSVSNSSASSITFTWGGAPIRMYGTNTASSGPIPAGKVWMATFLLTPHGTNLLSPLMQNN